MKDVQNQPDPRRLPIDIVGVKNLHYPITVLDRENGVQHTVGSINMYVNLPHRFRGTHMSRFIEVLNEHHQELHIKKIPGILEKMKTKLHAEEAHIEVRFPYFMERSAPVSGSKSLMEYHCGFLCTLREKADFVLTVEVPVSSLCPCSREISDRGAHNQRSVVTIEVRYKGFIWLEELIEMAEKAASSPLYALLKREDEKAVTESAYDNPRFVEDMVREVTTMLKRDKRITWFRVSSENFESIHNHSAYACIEKQCNPV